MEDPFYNWEAIIQNEQKELNRYLQEVVWPILPKQMFSGTSQVGDRYIHRLQNINKYFKDSNYYYTGNLKFIHYTNLHAFLNIINEKCLHLQDFNSFDDDPQEFAYALSKLFHTKSSLKEKQLKSCFNCISFCEYNDDNATDSFDMWRLYGKNGSGVAFVFSIEDNRELWEDYMLSKVYYGEDELNKFQDLDSRHQNFCENSTITFSDSMFDKENNRLPYQLYALFGFHKSSIYKIENEVRLMNVLNPFEPYINPNEHFYSITKNYEYTNYRKLSLISDEKNNLRKPVIKIEKLILGYRFNDNDLEKIKIIIETASRNKLDYCIQTELSHLRSFFEGHR